ncbi:MAG: PDZ domain-containing protein [Steroidobacteraceae bacterium]
MTKQQNQHAVSSAAPAVRRGGRRQWIGLVTVGLLAFGAALLYFQRGGSLPRPSNSGPADTVTHQDTAAVTGSPRDGVRTRVARLVGHWLPHLGSSSGGSDAPTAEQGGPHTARAPAGGPGVPSGSSGSQLAPTQDGQPGSDQAVPGGGAGRLAGVDSSSANAAGSQQTPVQREKVSRGLSARAGGGVEVDEVPSGSIAGKLGLQSGDVILSINGNVISSPEEFAAIYQQQGLPRQVEIIRDGRVLHRH